MFKEYVYMTMKIKIFTQFTILVKASICYNALIKGEVFLKGIFTAKPIWPLPNK